MTISELAEFWERQNYKIYVVTLRHPSNSRKRICETKYVRVSAASDTPRSRRRAARVATNNSIMFSPTRPVNYSARLADPESDLGCVRSEAPQ